jgi:predicted dehydrogenase
MIAARDRAGRFAAVGYQWSFMNCIQTLKTDIRAGFLGKPRRFKSLCLWPRDESYYGRNDWAGLVRDGEGRWVLDSPANNAMAHFLHNMLFCLGEEAGVSANPIRVQAEAYRANPIENYDTAGLRIETEGGVEVFLIVSHAVPEDVGPVFSFEFDGGKVEYAGGLSPITARLNDGSIKEYGTPEREEHFRKLWTCIAAVEGSAAGSGAASSGAFAEAGLAIPCGLEAARAQTLCVNGAQESIVSPCDFPEAIIRETGAAGRRLRWVEGLDSALRECFVKALFPSELGIPWARPGENVDLTGYNRFPRE